MQEREKMDDVQGVVDCLEGIASIAITQHQPMLGVTLFAAAKTWRKAHGAPLPPPLVQDYDLDLEQARLKLPPSLFDQAWSKGQTSTLGEIINLANSMTI